VNVVPGDATELIVRKGRVLLEPTHTKIKGGNKVIFSDNSFSVAKLQKGDKTRDNLEAWSKERAETLARANSRLPARALSSLVASYRSDWWLSNFRGRTGFWLFDMNAGFYTFFPFAFGWGSPYGTSYGSSFYGMIYRYYPSYWPASSGASGMGSGTGSGTGNAGATPNIQPRPSANPVSEAPVRVRDVQPASPGTVRRH